MSRPRPGLAGPHPTGQSLAAAAAEHHARTGRSGGNGSLMRTAPVALADLHDAEGLTEAAREVSALTHADPQAGEACVLWCLAIRHGVLHGTFDGLRLALDEAEANPPELFDRNGWVVQALQGAWSAIARTPVPPLDPASGSSPGQHFQHALAATVRGGRDTDTVAAIAGGLLGAVWGAAAVPPTWKRVVHGWPGLRAEDLARLGLRVANGGHGAVRLRAP